jgi:hypothetical protein
MGQLRKDWQRAKEKALDDFKKAHPIKGDPTKTPPTAFPIKFGLDLGPNLDVLEGTQDLGKLEKATDKSNKAITAYLNDVEKHKAVLTNPVATNLKTALTKLKTEVGKKGFH